MEVHIKNVSFLVNTFIGFIAISMFLLPVVSMGMMIKIGEELHFGMFIGFGLFCFFGYWMTRQFLWNVYGKEVVTFKNKKISYYSDFKYFQDSHKEIDAENFDVSVEELQEWDVKLGRIVFSNSEEELELAIKVPIEEANSITKSFLRLIEKNRIVT